MRNHASRQTAGYQHGVIKGDGARLGRPLDFTHPRPHQVPDREPADERERLGRIAYEANGRRLLPWYPTPVRWVDLPPVMQDAWCDAGEAVKAALSTTEEGH